VSALQFDGKKCVGSKLILLKIDFFFCELRSGSLKGEIPVLFLESRTKKKSVFSPGKSLEKPRDFCQRAESYYIIHSSATPATTRCLKHVQTKYRVYGQSTSPCSTTDFKSDHIDRTTRRTRFTRF